tara:strand:+ start:1901 stop:2944 length:1044 start_codon:yes stop_codon:yes gene_type:complete
MKSITNICLNSKKTLFDAMKNLEREGSQIVLVVDEEDKLLGTISDGDIRRSLLIGKSLETKVSEVMNKNCITALKGEKKQKLLETMKKKSINQIPILNEYGRILEVINIRELIEVSDTYDNQVLIMAGGIGSRLRPYTENCPKPMLTIGTKPLLEMLLEKLIESGFTNFYISVNYLKEKIINYFEDGSRWNININYLIENKPLGTAGSISLLPKEIEKPFIVMNGDILTKFNLNQLIDFHNKNNSFATICAREYEVSIPFGVIETDGIELKRIVEKPIYKNYVNAGLYAFDPKVLEFFSKNEAKDMPDLINEIKELKKKVILCPIHEYWLDIGRKETLKEAHKSWMI